MKQFIEKIKSKENLSFEESKSAFELLMEGKEIGRASCRERV